MFNMTMPLDRLTIGSKAVVKKIQAEGLTRRRLLDLGLVRNTEVTALHKSPSGDPIAYEIRGTVIALRSEESSKIIVEQIK